MPKAKSASITLPVLKKGERYAGLAFKDGAPSHHLILLPGSTNNATWEAAGAWAKKKGGDLPTRREQSLLFANLRDHIEGGWHWSNEQHASVSAYAWLQSFSYGRQNYWHKDYKYRAVAVRRVPISKAEGGRRKAEAS